MKTQDTHNPLITTAMDSNAMPWLTAEELEAIAEMSKWKEG